MRRVVGDGESDLMKKVPADEVFETLRGLAKGRNENVNIEKLDPFIISGKQDSGRYWVLPRHRCRRQLQLRPDLHVSPNRAGGHAVTEEAERSGGLDCEVRRRGGTGPLYRSFHQVLR